MDETRIYPRSSAFEALLARVYLELWELQDNPALFSDRVETFVSIFLPSMFQDKLKEKNPELVKKLESMKVEISKLEKTKTTADALTGEVIDHSIIPGEEADFAGEVWHAVIDVLTEAGFNFPMARQVSRRRME